MGDADGRAALGALAALLHSNDSKAACHAAEALDAIANSSTQLAERVAEVEGGKVL